MRSAKKLFAGQNRALWLAFALALAIHIAILMSLQWVASFKSISAEEEIVDVTLLTEQFEEKPEKTPEEEIEEYKPKDEIPDGQVVRAPQSPDRRPPEKKPRFLAEHDSRVEKETRALLRLPGVASTASVSVSKGDGQDNRSSEGGMRSGKEEEATLPPKPEKTERGDGPVERRAPMSLFDVNITPTMRAMSSALAGTGLDNLEDVVDGDQTALNTAGWRYAAFFNRVKSKVEQYWHPDVEYGRHDPYGNIYGYKNRVTVLLVVLYGDGSLKKLYVMDPSGAGFLDREALDAVENAAPFPNVPEGLKDRRDGLVKFTFHFIVDVGESPVFRIRRYQ